MNVKPLRNLWLKTMWISGVLALIGAGCAGGGSSSALNSLVPRAIGPQPGATGPPSPNPTGSAAPSAAPNPQPSRSPQATPSPTSIPTGVTGVPNAAHVSVLIMENENYSALVAAGPPYLLGSLKPASAWFTQAYAVAHKSQPNYFALFAGTTEGLSGGGQSTDACPPAGAPYSADIAAEAIAGGFTFAGWVEDNIAWNACNYSRNDPAGAPLQVNRHTPWVNFSDVPHSVVHDWPPGSVPDVSANITFLIPSQMDNMHDSTIGYGDAYLASIVPGIMAYDAANNGLLVILWDEADADNTNGGGHIAMLLVGPMIKPGSYSQTVNDYNVLRTIEDIYRLPYLGATGGAAALSGIWR
ncbi:MAG: alkaline phosphatase family protein [Candidatus Eremiobacteraeota bacterium]|nr:alkaline phosphatase family protein [Candidatus Eremiobacteraeota bacterium]